MIDPADIRFFQTLALVCHQTDGVDTHCQNAIKQALDTRDPQDMRAARHAVDALDDVLKDQILQQVHRRMATDISAIWDVMSYASGQTKERPN